MDDYQERELRARVREEFAIAMRIGAAFDIDSAMMNVDALVEAARRSSPSTQRQVEEGRDTDADGKFAQGILVELARRGATPAGLSLATQLFGVGPCTGCGYRKLYCKCAAHPGDAPEGSGNA